MKNTLVFSFLMMGLITVAQHNDSKRTDAHLRGAITPEREWWDLEHYQLDVSIDPEQKSLKGSNTITYKVVGDSHRLQLDLQPPMVMEKIVQNGKELTFEKEGANAYMVTLQDAQEEGKTYSLTAYYSGVPRVAKRAPWDGGFSWSEDEKGNTFAATSCQGLGASVWWPCKDHMYDEPNGMDISIEVPNPLVAVANGRLDKVEEKDTSKVYHWKVVNPISNYVINANLGNYVHFNDKYEGEAGTLDLDYYVLPENLEKAKKQFKETNRTIEAFEHWFGPYPFYEDGFKLVEVPYLGMEHQSSVTYGNKYQNGYLGRDLSRSGWGLKFDFIIVHEGGHEWFANNITYKDIADMWIHESFTAYSETLFLDYHFGSKAGNEYVQGTRDNILNDKPIIGEYNLNSRGSGDMYYKGASMIHTLRQLIEDDDKFRGILRNMNATFRHQTVTTKQIEDFLSEKTGKDLKAFFDQYLRTTMVPTLEYQRKGKKLLYRYTNVVNGFDMPVKLKVDGKSTWIYPSMDGSWKKQKLKGDKIEIDPNMYVKAVKI